MSYLRQWAESKNGKNPTLFPQEASNTITIFPRYRDVRVNLETNVTVFLENCVWNESTIETQNRTGALGANRQYKVTVKIPYLSKYSKRKYVSATRWAQLNPEETGEFWTINPRQLPIACNGRFDFEWPWGTSAQIVTIENQLMTPGHANFNASARRLIDINEQLLGIFPDNTEDENYELFPEKFPIMGHLWQITIQA